MVKPSPAKGKGEKGRVLSRKGERNTPSANADTPLKEGRR